VKRGLSVQRETGRRPRFRWRIRQIGLAGAVGLEPPGGSILSVRGGTRTPVGSNTRERGEPVSAGGEYLGSIARVRRTGHSALRPPRRARGD
jgi:hypothetical protein